MRSDPADFEISHPSNLEAALALLAKEPAMWLPIAGGTDIMVQFAAGTLAARKLLDIWNLGELRGVAVRPDEIEIGTACTYTELREHPIIVSEFPLLALAASWTGGIANQNRGTLGGNIANASPAGDSLPSLLAYAADLKLVSVRGERRVPYADFHVGYKKMNLAKDELIRGVCLPRRFLGYSSYGRKVGTRNAQAISKVCIAALARLEKGTVKDVRIALGSVAPTPIRLPETERILEGKSLDRELVVIAQKAALSEVRPISDVRSTAGYRARVAQNLVGEFLQRLAQPAAGFDAVLARWNQRSLDQAQAEILACCGSRAWARSIASRRPIPGPAALLAAADEVWRGLSPADWLEAFRSHPRIGESPAPEGSEHRSSHWSVEEQSGMASENHAVRLEVARLNREYERRFGQIFIVCATGKTAAEILQILRRRLLNDPQTELREAAEQQRQIMQIRLQKWLSE